MRLEMTQNQALRRMTTQDDLVKRGYKMGCVREVVVLDKDGEEEQDGFVISVL